MSIKLTRREVLQFVGGSALGLLFTPIPWKAVDDTAIWSQNWPWIPKAPKGEISYTGTTCTLCQSACGMRARLAGKQPVSTSGMAQHPFNDGSLCTMGILAHHLRYHPSRLRQPVKFAPGADAGVTLTPATAMDELAQKVRAAAASGTVVILDGRPERTASAAFRQVAAANGAFRYIPVSAPALDVLHAMTADALAAIGYDVDSARTILNFGAPLSDMWGTPSRAARTYTARSAKRQMVIHIEGVCSRSAERADQWVAARPGTEALVALAVANILVNEKLCPAAALRNIGDLADLSAFIDAFTPEAVQNATGVTPATVRSMARTFASQSPSLAIIGNDASYEARAAVMLLNVLTGAVGRTGGVALRSNIPEGQAFTVRASSTASLHDMPDHSVRALIIDESLSGCVVPDALLEKKLSKDGIVVSLSPFVTPRPYCTQYMVPSTVMFETLTDVPGPFDAAVSSLAIATQMLPPPEGTTDALQFAIALASALGSPISAAGTTEDLLKQRTAAIHASKRGTVFTPSTSTLTAVKQLGSADDLWTALAAGGCWMDDAAAVKPPRSQWTVMKALRTAQISVPHTGSSGQLTVVPFAEQTVYDGTMVSPLLSKVSQESGLRLSLHQAYLNPATAQAHAIINGDAMTLTTAHGTMEVRAKLNPSVMPDVIFVSMAGTREHTGTARAAQDVRLLCDVSVTGSINSTPVTIQKAQA